MTYDVLSGLRALFAGSLLGLALAVSAQFEAGMPGLGAKPPAPPNEPEAELEPVVPAAVDASAQMDSQANALFMQAQAFAAEGKYELVFRLLEEAMALGGKTMATADGVHYLPARLLANQILMSLPEEALQAYRLLSDPIVRHRLNVFRRNRDRELLADAYQHKFLSTFGDNAAFQLACMHLDQQEFPEARRILDEIRYRHPDADIGPQQLLPRLALACVRSGDLVGARKAWEDFRRHNDPVPARWQPIEQQMKALAEQRRAVADEVSAAYGDARRLGRMAAFEKGAKDPQWLVQWTQKYQVAVQPQRRYYGNLAHLNVSHPSSPAQLTEKMRKHHWRPTDQVLFDRNRVWYGSHPNTYCYDLETGKKVWTAKARVENSTTRRYYNPRRGKPPADEPATAQDKWNFGYRLNRDMSRIDDTVYRIEANGKASYVASMFAVMVRNGQRVRQEMAIGNILSAYDAKNGKLKWRIGRELGARKQVVIDRSSPAKLLPLVRRIKIDGNPKDWQGRGLRLALKGKPNPKGDFEVEAYAAWNEQGLVVRTKVIDSKIMEFKDHRQLFRGDSIEYFLADARGSWNMYQAFAATGIDPKFKTPRNYIIDHRRNRRPKSAGKLTAQYGYGKVDGGYLVEALFPWANLGIDGKQGGELALQLYVNDWDDPKKRWTTSWFPKQGTHANPGNMYRVRLADARGRLGKEKPATKQKKLRHWTINRIRFLAAPVKCAGKLIVPMENDLGLNIVALDPESGMPLWQTRVASSMPSMEAPESAVHLTVRGVHAYLCSGRGHIACIDTTDGMVLWLSTYESTREAAMRLEAEARKRAAEAEAAEKEAADKTKKKDKKKDKKEAPKKPAPEKEELNIPELPKGWKEDLVLCDDARVVAFPTDAPTMVCLSRGTGRQVWLKARPKAVNYVVGVYGRQFVVGGATALMAFEMATGKRVWSAGVSGTTGRACLAGDEILVPVHNQVWRLDAATGKRRAVVNLRTPDQVSLGNLYVVADGLLVVGPDRLYLVRDIRDDMNRLNARIAKTKDPQAYLERGITYYLLTRYKDALRDLQIAFDKLGGGKDKEKSREYLVQAAFEYAQTRPPDAEAWLRKAASLARTQLERLETSWALGRYLEHRKKTDDALRVYLNAMASASGRMMPAQAGKDNWQVPGRAAIWGRIQILRQRASKELAAEINRSLSGALEEAAKAEDTAELAAYAADFRGAAEASKAGFMAVDRYIKAKQNGMAAAMLIRLQDHGDAATRRHAGLQLVKLYLAAGNRLSAESAYDELRRSNPKWQPAALTAVARQLDDTGAKRGPDALLVTPPLKLAWTSAIPGRYSQLQQLRPGAWYYMNYQSGRVGALDMATGKKVWETKVDKKQLNTFRLNPPTNLIADGAATEIKVTDVFTGKPVHRFKSVLPGAVIQGCDDRGIAPAFGTADGGSVAAFDLLAKRALWKQSRVLQQLGNLRNMQFRISGGRIRAFGYTQDYRHLKLMEFDTWTGTATTRKVDRRKASSLFQSSRSSIYAPPEIPDDVKLAGGRLISRDRKTKKVIWQSPANLKISAHYPVAANYGVLKLAGNAYAVIRLSDGKIMFNSGKKALAWPRVHRNTHRYYRRYINYDANSGCIQLRSQRPPYQVVYIQAATGKVMFDGKMPNKRTYPMFILGRELLLVRASKARKVGKRTVYSGYAYRLMQSNGKFSPITLPLKQDMKKGEDPRHFQPLRLPGMVVMFNRNKGRLLAYKSAGNAKSEAGTKKKKGK